MLKHEHDHMFTDNVAYANVENSLEEILTRSSIVKDMFEKGQIGLVGGVYNIETGKVDFFKNLTKSKKKQQQLAAKV
jgi:carbonic anhydrase